MKNPFRLFPCLRRWVWLVVLGVSGAAGMAQAMDLKDRHATLGLECTSCHGQTDKPRKPTTKACLTCHESNAKLAESTAKLEPNPHKSHLGELRCTYCHASHGEGKIYCNECHQFPQLKLK